MAAPVPFTRDSLTAYEKQPAAAAPAPVAAESQKPAAQVQAPVADTPVVESDALDTSSVDDVPADPAVPGEDGTSVETGDSTTPTADLDSETPIDETGDGKPRSRGTAQERIEELVTERNAYRKYGEHLLATINELKGMKNAPATSIEAPAPAPIADSSDDPPTLEQHQFDPVAFSKAQSKWLKDQVAKGVRTAIETERGQQASADAHAKFIEREAVTRKEFADFDVVTSKNPNFPKLATKAATLIVRSEYGPRIAYELGRNPGLGARIEKMDADSQIAAIGRIEGGIIALKVAPPSTVKKPAPAQKTVTKAPPPPTPVRGSSNPQKQISEMSMDEFVAHERAQKLAKREQNLKIRRAMR